MITPTDQFKFPVDLVDSERKAADLAKSMDALQQSKDISDRPVTSDVVPETRDDRIARARQDLDTHLWDEHEQSANPELSLIEKHMIHLTDISDRLESDRNRMIQQ